MGRTSFVCSRILYIQRVRRRIAKKFALRNTIFGGGQYLCKYSWNVVKFRGYKYSILYCYTVYTPHCYFKMGSVSFARSLSVLSSSLSIFWIICLIVCPFSLVVCSFCLFCLLIWPFFLSLFCLYSLSVLPSCVSVLSGSQSVRLAVGACLFILQSFWFIW